MATFANITVKKSDGTTDIVWTGVSPSNGNGSPAIWKSQTVGSASAHQPEFRLSSKDNSDATKRLLRSTFAYPQIATDSTTSLTMVVNTARFDINWQVPRDMPSVDVAEAVDQFANLLKSALVIQAVKEGFSPI